MDVVQTHDLETLADKLDELLATTQRVFLACQDGSVQFEQDRIAARRLKRYFQPHDRIPPWLMRREDVVRAIGDALDLLTVGLQKKPTVPGEFPVPTATRLTETSKWLRSVITRLKQSSLTEQLEAVLNVLETQPQSAVGDYYLEAVDWMNIAVINVLAAGAGLTKVFESERRDDGNRRLTVIDPAGGRSVVFDVPKDAFRKYADISRPKIDRAVELLGKWRDRSLATPAAPNQTPSQSPNYASMADPVPDQYCTDGRPNGPLTGNQRQLAWAVDPVVGREPKARVLKRLHGTRVFVQKESGQRYHVYFLNMRAFHDARKQLQQICDDPKCWKAERRQPPA